MSAVSLRSLAGQPFELLAELEGRCRAAAAGRSTASVQAEWVGVGYRMRDTLLVSSRDQVKEVLNYPTAITRIPGAKRWLRGLANVRGSLLPIVDLAHFLGGEETPLGRATRVVVVNHRDAPTGLVVDEVRGFRRFTSDEGVSANSVALGPIAPFVSGAYGRADERWAVLDLHRLVESPVFLQAAE